MKRLWFKVGLPPRALSPNSRTGSSRLDKAADVRAFRGEVAWSARIAKESADSWAVPDIALVSLIYCLKDRPAPLGKVDRATSYHPTDPDNALSAFKAGLDGLRDAGVVRGDEWGAVRLSVEQAKDRGPYIEITIEGAAI